MDYNKKLQRYIKATSDTMQMTYEWYVNELNKTGDVSYISMINSMESFRDDMQGAIGFAHFADLISEEQFNEAWKLVYSIFSTYSAKVWDVFFRKEGE